MNPFEDFSLSLWLDGDQFKGIPDRVDKYRPGHTSWGKCPKRAGAIQRSRSRKAYNKNLSFFMGAVFPTIKDKLTHEQLFEVSRIVEDPSIAVGAGYILWSKGKASQWLHRDDPLTQKAIEIGAQASSDISLS